MLGDCSSELRAGDAFDISLNTASPSGLPRRDADWQLQQTQPEQHRSCVSSRPCPSPKAADMAESFPRKPRRVSLC